MRLCINYNVVRRGFGPLVNLLYHAKITSMGRKSVVEERAIQGHSFLLLQDVRKGPAREILNVAERARSSGTTSLLCGRIA